MLQLLLLALIPISDACTMTCSEMQCPNNSHTLSAGATSIANCLCDTGYWRNGSCQACSPGFICSNELRSPCPAGYWSDGISVFDCLQGYKCPTQSVDRFGRTSANLGIECSSGWFLSVDNVCLRCPVGTTSTSYGCKCDNTSMWWNRGECVACATGWLCGSNWTSACPSGVLCYGNGSVQCPVHHACEGGLDLGCMVDFGGSNCTACAEGQSKKSVGYGNCDGVVWGWTDVWLIAIVFGGLIFLCICLYSSGLQYVKKVFVFNAQYSPLSIIDIPIDHAKLF